jgi:c-di-GMP-binding flagellar brake protein YcgR
MSTLHFRRVERRRTDRVSVFADLTVQGFTENNEKFKLQTRSLCVSGYGGLTILDASVVVGQTLLITNENSRQKAECKIVSLRPGGDGKTIVAFEFISPNTNFWKMSFPAAGAKPLRRAIPSTATA